MILSEPLIIILLVILLVEIDMNIVRPGLTFTGFDTGFYTHHENPPLGAAMCQKPVRPGPVIVSETNHLESPESVVSNA
jgi:hypothetical protein